MSDQSSSGNVGSGGNVGSEFKIANVVDEVVSNELEMRGVNINVAVPGTVENNNITEGGREVVDTSCPTTAHIIPADRAGSSLLLPDHGNDQFTLGELIAHYTDLLSRGYRATRWQHPRFGVEELLPSGQWKFTAIFSEDKKEGEKT